MAEIQHFRDSLDGLAKARIAIQRYQLELDYDLQRWGSVVTSLSGRERYVPQVKLQIEACFRFLKFLNHGDFANQRDSYNLWLEAGKYRPQSDQLELFEDLPR